MLQEETESKAACEHSGLLIQPFFELYFPMFLLLLFFHAVEVCMSEKSIAAGEVAVKPLLLLSRFFLFLGLNGAQSSFWIALHAHTGKGVEYIEIHMSHRLLILPDDLPRRLLSAADANWTSRCCWLGWFLLRGIEYHWPPPHASCADVVTMCINTVYLGREHMTLNQHA